MIFAEYSKVHGKLRVPCFVMYTGNTYITKITRVFLILMKFLVMWRQ